MHKTESERFTSDPRQMQLFQQERLILDVTELMYERMEKKGLKRSQIAKILGKTRGRITQILDGEENLTLRTISDVFCAMGDMLCVSAEPIKIESDGWGFITTCVKLSWASRPGWNIEVTPADPNGMETLAG